MVRSRISFGKGTLARSVMRGASVAPEPLPVPGLPLPSPSSMGTAFFRTLVSAHLTLGCP
jgi:hypothetical protein